MRLTTKLTGHLQTYLEGDVLRTNLQITGFAVIIGVTRITRLGSHEVILPVAVGRPTIGDMALQGEPVVKPGNCPVVRQ